LRNFADQYTQLYTQSMFI